MAFGEKAKGFTTQTKCPISGKPIDTEVTASHNDQTVYFCCAGCPAKFKENPEKILAAINAPSLTYKSGSCCDKAVKNGDACSHGCCVTAAAAGKACAKCNG
jgi:YHS domain-containing protein